MRRLTYSKDLKHIVELPDTLTAEEALDILTVELLGKDYYIVDPLHSHQANVIIVEDILRTYKRRPRRLE